MSCFLCFVAFFKDVLVFCLSFIFSFILHPCIIPLLISSFLSLLPLDYFVYSWQKGRKYTREYTGLYRHFYMTHVHTLKWSNSNSCTFVGGESHRGDAYTRGRRHFFFKKTLFCLCFILCLSSHFFMVLWVMFSIYALLLSSHHAYVLDIHLSLGYCALLVACSNYHLLCYMIIVVISIWLSDVWSSCSHVSHHAYLITFYLLHYTCPFITWFTLRV